MLRPVSLSADILRAHDATTQQSSELAQVYTKVQGSASNPNPFQSVLIPPGEVFASPGHLRFSSALPPDYLKAGLDRFGEVLDGLGD